MLPFFAVLGYDHTLFMTDKYQKCKMSVDQGSGDRDQGSGIRGQRKRKG